MRLTESFDKTKYDCYDIEAIGIRSDYFLNSEKVENAIDKLGQLEDIEDDLGIDLITLFKALRQFFAKDLDCYCPRPTSLFQDVRNEWYIQWMGNYYKLKDYGKTWALTKEELEK